MANLCIRVNFYFFSLIGASQCTKWIEKPTFLHVSNAVHIYFKILNLYNIHKAIYDEGLSDGEYFVMRMGYLVDEGFNQGLYITRPYSFHF